MNMTDSCHIGYANISLKRGVLHEIRNGWNYSGRYEKGNCLL